MNRFDALAFAACAVCAGIPAALQAGLLAPVSTMAARAIAAIHDSPSDIADRGNEVGACCIFAGDAGYICEIRTSVECAAALGIYRGDGSVCRGDLCQSSGNAGACCYDTPDGPRCVVTTSSNCESTYAGEYLGDGSLCTPECPPSGEPVTGACCFGNACLRTLASDCFIAGGTYIGDDTLCIGDEREAICPRTDPVGACCFFAEPYPPGCVITTAEDCLNRFGSYAGDGTRCDDDDDWCGAQFYGACCFFDPVLVSCVVISPDACEDNGGVFQGFGTDCPNDGCRWSPDIDGDGIVALPDLARLLAKFGLCRFDSEYDPRVDLDRSECVDLADLALLLTVFGN
ncbi:MAG: hypothetical protein ACKVS9_01090 [Phycisphaerae bacterium]